MAAARQQLDGAAVGSRAATGRGRRGWDLGSGNRDSGLFFYYYFFFLFFMAEQEERTRVLGSLRRRGDDGSFEQNPWLGTGSSVLQQLHLIVVN